MKSIQPAFAGNTRMCETPFKLTIKTSKRFIDVMLVPLISTLERFHTFWLQGSMQKGGKKKKKRKPQSKND